LNGVSFPEGFHLERLRGEHPRRRFHCGELAVDDWLTTKALQHQKKRLSVTKVLIDQPGTIAGFYTLATGQVDFGDLPADVARHLPRRALPVAVLAWLGVDGQHRGKGLGELLLAQALRDCWEAGATFPFIAVILDCINESTKAFYRRWDFAELPGHPFRLFLSAKHLEVMIEGK
jgi:GNAT superfamily N-acetyltransferase